ncbi:TPA: 4Fe-4S dicluster domain-containing protein [Candidatus Avacholeplasma faecigallinarum]|nr:4Fe-4S dicluster domain-containing protein [Candidatus Avacholeplasma faecigallinarum]
MLDSYASIIKIRRKVFEEVARLAYEGGDYSRIEEIPYQMLRGQAKYRESIFLERAIVAERIRLAIGLPVRSADEHEPISKGIEGAIKTERFYEPPLVNVIDFACNACPQNSYFVTDTCVGCLANPCANVCPKDAIRIVNGRSIIDQNKCIKCGRCKDVCPYGAIVHRERPCEKACGMDAIESDEHGRAKINYDKCVSCGMCIVNCPFGAIADKSQLFQVIQTIKSEYEVYAIMAPAFVGQFGPKVNLKTIDDAMSKLGFNGVYEVSIGADLCTIEEAQDFLDNVPSKLKFMGTSCCPSWSVMAKKEFPEFKDNISMALTPMVLTARLVKKEHPNCKIVFVGPCSAKKLEASRKSVRSDVDFVLTFEELMGMFIAKNVDFNTLTEKPLKNETSADGRGFAVSGGVAQAVVNVIKRIDPTKDAKVESAQGLRNCKKLLQMAKAGKYDGYLLEGMACPLGCVSGAGTIATSTKTKAMVEVSKRETPLKNCIDSKYKDKLDLLD